MNPCSSARACQSQHFSEKELRKGRTWAIAVRRGPYKSLILPNSGLFSPKQQGDSVLNFGSRKTA